MGHCGTFCNFFPCQRFDLGDLQALFKDRPCVRARQVGFCTVIAATPATGLRLENAGFRFLTSLRCVRNDRCWIFKGLLSEELRGECSA